MASVSSVSFASSVDISTTKEHKDPSQISIWLDEFEANLASSTVNMDHVFANVEHLQIWYAQNRDTVYLQPSTEAEARESVAFNTLLNKLYVQFCKLLPGIPVMNQRGLVSSMTYFYRKVCMTTSFLPSLTQVKCVQDHVGTDVLLFEADEEVNQCIRYLVNLFTQLGIRTICINVPRTHETDENGIEIESLNDVKDRAVTMKNVLESKKYLIGNDEVVLGMFLTTNEPSESMLRYFYLLGGTRVLLLGTSRGNLWTTERHYLSDHFDCAQIVNNISISTSDDAQTIKKVPAPLQVYKARSRLMSATWLPEHAPLSCAQSSYPLQFESCESPNLKFLTLLASSSISIPAHKTCSVVEWVTEQQTTPPCWIPVLTTPHLHSGSFTVAMHVDSMQKKQIGVGFYLAQTLPYRVDYGFFGYLGSSTTSWSCDPSTGDIVTATRSVCGSLPTFKNKTSGMIRMHFTLRRDSPGFMQFEVDGCLIPYSVQLPTGAVVVPACCLLSIHQRVTIAECIRTGTPAPFVEPPLAATATAAQGVANTTAVVGSSVTLLKVNESSISDMTASEHHTTEDATHVATLADAALQWMMHR